ncbi:MAG: hypothetical protein GC149_16440 [Gammaproteobacteria bacterium]|nr:hypothetical protein [Gammaproteobacteria bacterium]
MLGSLGLGILSFMLAMYALTVVYGLSFAVVYMTKKLGMHAVRTIAYVILLALTTALTALPFLKMHGSYSDTARWLIILLCLANIILMLVFAISRVKVLFRTSAAAQSSDTTAGD